MQMRRSIQQARSFRIAGRPAPGVGRDLEDEPATVARAGGDPLSLAAEILAGIEGLPVSPVPKRAAGRRAPATA